MFFRRQPKESPDELVNRLQQEGRVDQLEQELERYNLAKLGTKDKERLYHLRGVAAFRKGDRDTAFERFKEAQRECPDSAEIRFSLGQEYEARGEINEMFACFDGCAFPAVSSQFMLAAARYAYLWGHPARGEGYLTPIAESYFQLGIADDHFVYVRGLPFFSQTWSYLVAFAWMQDSYDATDRLLKRSKSELSDYDFDHLGRFYEAHKRSDFADYAAELATSLESQDANFPSGYQRVQIAALRAVANHDPNSAVQGLQGVELSENDSPWLNDVMTVHTARSYWKAGRTDEETTRREIFLSKQQMLFEPDHAYWFSFLDYQELLRPLYQKRRSRVPCSHPVGDEHAKRS